eukprot:752874-Prymnesium_polylepis.1
MGKRPMGKRPMGKPAACLQQGQSYTSARRVSLGPTGQPFAQHSTFTAEGRYHSACCRSHDARTSQGGLMRGG